MADFEIKEGDSAPAFVARCLDANGKPIPTLGATVTFRMMPQVPGLRPAIVNPAVWSDTAKAEATYAWQPGDTDVPGLYNAEIHVVFGGGLEETFPNGGYMVVEILDAALADGPYVPPPPAGRLQDASDLSGTPGTGKGWVRAPDGSMAWTDLATQAELDAAIALHATQLMSSHYDPRLQWLGQDLKRTLAAAVNSFGLAVLSDSTADGVTDWPWLLATAIGVAYPAYTVRGTVFSDPTQSYPVPTTIQTGTAGPRYMRFVAATNNTLSLESTDVAAHTDLDVQIKVSLDDWTPATVMTLASQFGSAGQRSWEFYVNTNGKLGLQFSQDGTTLLNKQSVPASGIADGTISWVRVTYLGNDGSGNNLVKFWTSTDGIAWVQLGSTITTAGVGNLFASTYQYELGGRQGTTQVTTGNFYEIRIMKAIDSVATVAPCFPEHWGGFPTLTAPPDPTGAPILHLSIGAVAGKGVTYLGDTTRLPKLLPDYSHRAVFMATNHNESNLTGANWTASWKTWVANVLVSAYNAAAVIMTENPPFPPSIYLREKTIRREQLLALAVQLGVPSFDAWQSFLDTGNALALTQADGTHPTATGAGDGQHVWAADLYKALFTGV